MGIRAAFFEAKDKIQGKVEVKQPEVF